MTPVHSLKTDNNSEQTSWKFLVGALLVTSVFAFLATYLFKDQIIQYLRSTQGTTVQSDTASGALPGDESANKWQDLVQKQQNLSAEGIEGVTDLTASQMSISETTENKNLVVGADPATSAKQTRQLADFTNLSVVLISLKPVQYILLSDNRRYQPGELIFEDKYELAAISADTLTLSTVSGAVSVALK
ncbi:MAG: hypothetical protein V3U76_20595 [Granulosicoccus sp.]